MNYDVILFEIYHVVSKLVPSGKPIYKNVPFVIHDEELMESFKRWRVNGVFQEMNIKKIKHIRRK